MSSKITAVTPRPTAEAHDPIVEVDGSVPLIHASVNVTLGALLDPPGKEGTTRLLLRLMRRTGAGRTADTADDVIDRMGGHVGADVSRHHSSFHGSAIARSTADFLRFLEDTVARPGLDAGEFRRLLDESRAELVEKLDDDRSLARSFFHRRVFAGHPYARLAGGTRASLDRIEQSDVEEQFRRIFVRSALRFAFAGKIDVTTAREAAERLASLVPAGATDEPELEDPTGPTGRHLLFVDKPDRTQTQILIGGLGSWPSDEDHVALHVGNTVFGGTFTARLSQEVRAKRGWSYGAYSSLPFDKKRQSFSLWTFPAATDAAACIRLELELLERWVEAGITPKELGRAKKYLVRSHAFAVDTASKRAGLALDECLSGLPPRYHEEYLDRVNSVTLDQVNESIRKRIAPAHLVVTVVGTHTDIGADVRAAIGSLASEEVVRFDAPDYSASPSAQND